MGINKMNDSSSAQSFPVSSFSAMTPDKKQSSKKDTAVAAENKETKNEAVASKWNVIDVVEKGLYEINRLDEE